MDDAHLDPHNMLDYLAKKSGYDKCCFMTGTEHIALAFKKNRDNVLPSALLSKRDMSMFGNAAYVTFKRCCNHKDNWQKALDAVLEESCKGNFIYIVESSIACKYRKIVIEPYTTLEKLLVGIDLGIEE